MENEELLQKYFLEELSPSELEAFYTLLEKDPGLKEQFEFEKDVQTVIKSKERAALKHKIQELENEHDASKLKASFKWKPLGIAASVVALLGFGWYMYTSDAGPNMKQLYAKNYETYPNTVYPITRDGGEDSPERKAFVSYESEDYSAAIPIFEALKADGGADYIDFYLAQSYLQTERAQKAILLFEEIMKREGQFDAEARWYLALAHLMNEDADKAKKTLETIVTVGDYKQTEAEVLLRKLN